MGNQIKSQLQKTPIAIIGMASLFPQSRNLQEFWDNILNKISCITDVPTSHWEINDLYDPNPNAPDKTYCKRGGFIPDIDFNPMEFGLPPNILEVTDSSQLLSLVVARDLIKDCGFEDGNFDRANTGVILGVGGGQKLITPLVSRLQGPIWEKVLRSAGVEEKDIQILIGKMKKAYIPWVENSFPGMLGNVIAGRVANRLDLGGTNCVVDAACAGSLAAMKMAVSDLLERKANMMITGGVDTDNSPFMYLNFSKTPAFTSDEVAKPFDEQSKGIIIGEGVGMIMLKRLEDAERDNDRIYAVIKGIGSSSDGKFKSIYSPRASGQALAVNRAYEDAGIHHNTVSLVEAHGTGTRAGDAAEFDGLKAAFDHEGHETGYIALGSVKSQIGHTKTAAGAAGLIKVALALYHKVLPPTINVTQPNPKLGIAPSSFYINSQTRPWINPAQRPRRAGVSAFGFGGSNYHFVLEEYTREPEGAYRLHHISRPFVVQGKNPNQLKEKCSHWISAMLSDDTGMKFYNFVQEAQDPAIPREHARIGFVAKDQAEVIEMLQAAVSGFDREAGNPVWSHPKGLFYRQHGFGPEAKVVAVFSGQGSQYVNMCSELAVNFPPIRDAFAQMGNLYPQDDSTHLCKAVYPQPAFDDATREDQNERIKLTQYIQPSVACIGVGLFRMLTAIGFKPDICVGHSFGELTALWAAGVLDDESYFSLSRSRSIAMAAPPADADYDTGAMLAVMGEADEIEEKIKQFDRVSIANFNSPKQVVIAGPKASILAAQTALKEDGFSVVKLPVTAAFHTPLVGYAHKPFADAIDKITFHEPKSAVFSNVTAEIYPKSARAIKESFKKNMLTSVRFSQEIRAVADAGGTIFVEFGPKNVLTKLVEATVGDAPHLSVALNASPNKCSDLLYRQALVQLKVAGVNITLKDKYQPDIPQPEPRKPGMYVKINGSNYVSDATRKAFVDALNDGYKLPRQVVTKTVEVQVPVAASAIPAAAATNRSAASRPVIEHAAPANDASSHFSAWMDSQAETLKTHAAYLQGQQDYSRQFFRLMDSIVGEYGAKGISAPDNIMQGLSDFHGYQQDTLRIHEQYLQNQVAFNTSAYQLIHGQASSPLPARAMPAMSAPPVAVASQAPHYVEPVPAAKPVAQAPAATGLNSAAIQKGLLEIVKEKTGYPVEMLDLNMDMEADLGIDSIKRVEILGAVTAKFPGLPEMDQNALAEMRTLGEIVRYVESLSGGVTPAAVAVAAPANAAASTAHGTNSAQVQTGLLEIVKEKTGYPVEMLDLNMDMEADLGIDSIKRVEILGAVTAKFPGLPEMDQNALAEMRTLGEIVRYVESLSGGVTPAAVAVAVAAPAVAAPATAGGINSAAVQTGLLEIVKEKTGYPVEMLDLNMDMEADLGIDSIKRVEILGAVTTRFPGLPEMDQNALAEMRTLGEIVRYVESLSGGAAAAAAHAVVTTATAGGTNSAQVQTGLLEIVKEKTGYPVEMLDLNMDMEADLGIDSIKRVEILGAVTTKFPGLPEMDQNALAEMRTLGEIVRYVEALVPQHAANAATPTVTVTSSTVKKKLLGRPDALPAELAIQGRTCVITDNGSKATHHLADKLIDSGWKVVVLRFPESLVAKHASLPKAATAIDMVDETEASLAAAIDSVSEIHGFVHLSAKPHLPKGTAVSFSRQEETILKLVFLSAKYVQKHLTKACDAGRNFFVTVSYMDGEIGTGGTQRFELNQGGLNGLVKTLNLEWEQVFCRAIDLSPDISDDQSGQLIFEELFDADITMPEVGISAKGRMTLAAVTRPDPLPPITHEKIKESSVFLVSGGAKGVTAACAIQLATQFHCRFILLGRAVYNGGVEAAWSDGISDEAELKRRIMVEIQNQGEKPTPKRVTAMLGSVMSDREIGQTLAALARVGGKVEYVSADVTNTKALKEKVAPAIARLGAITGLIHGAGVLADKPIQKKTEEDFNAIFSTKIHGLEGLLSLTSEDTLEYLVLFSSAAGFYGNNGQSDYSVANEILNKTAYQYAHFHKNCHVVSFNWGPWDGGMVTAELKRYFKERNVEIIPLHEGAEIFQGELNPARKDTVQLLVGSSMRPQINIEGSELQSITMNRTLTVDDNVFLKDHVIGGNPVLPSAAAVTWMADSCEKTHPGFRFVQCENFQVLKGIVFDAKQPDDYQVTVAEVAKSNATGIQCQVSIASSNPKKKMAVPHFQAEVTLMKQDKEVAAPAYGNMDIRENTAAKDGALLYKDGTLFHGLRFQGLRRVLNHSEQKLTLLCHIPGVDEHDQGQFPLNTTNMYATDLMFQAMLVWVRMKRDMGSLPLKFVRMEQYQPIPCDVDFYISVDVVSTSETNLVADVIIHDGVGSTYARANGAEVTISANLNALFAKR